MREAERAKAIAFSAIDPLIFAVKKDKIWMKMDGQLLVQLGAQISIS
jgi:hypothetical protein